MADKTCRVYEIKHGDRRSIRDAHNRLDSKINFLLRETEGELISVQSLFHERCPPNG